MANVVSVRTEILMSTCTARVEGRVTAQVNSLLRNKQLSKGKQYVYLQFCKQKHLSRHYGSITTIHMRDFMEIITHVFELCTELLYKYIITHNQVFRAAFYSVDDLSLSIPYILY